ncbi:MAG: hypothetical protein WC979_06210 [Candidatus Pacearchaeota archaeon]|jgi:hypothetical protein
MEDNSKRYEEERKRIMQKYGVSKKFEPETSRYLEYRKKEKLREERIKHPEKFESKAPEEKAETTFESIILEEEVEAATKKKSWFSKLFKK